MSENRLAGVVQTDCNEFRETFWGEKILKGYKLSLFRREQNQRGKTSLLRCENCFQRFRIIFGGKEKFLTL